jgi:hypothetical protein
MDNLKTLLAALTPLAWQLIVCVLLFTYRRQLGSLIEVGISRVQRGDEVKIGLITIGQSVGQLKQPSSAEHLTDDHLALIHRSWRVPERDEEFGRPMHQIHIIVFGTADALRRIDYVVYRLEPAYPSPVRLGGSLETNFELKELANGYSLVRADVYARGQQEPVRLSRLIDLTEQSPPLKGSYQTMVPK